MKTLKRLLDDFLGTEGGPEEQLLMDLKRLGVAPDPSSFNGPLDLDGMGRVEGDTSPEREAHKEIFKRAMRRYAIEKGDPVMLARVDRKGS
ncbi:hypothetical protein ABIE64_002667 [Thalassospira sp. MBR-102]|jgi:hypothetical protein|uniref:hypothetical protein n=1 Tax=Thalassospira sp. MBR-102 TaxID=3156466 RepID=UPI003393F094